MVIGSLDDNVYVLNGEDGSLVWSYETGGPVESSPALGDVDGDGRLEVVIGSTDYNVYCFAGEGFRVFWQGMGGDFYRAKNVLFIDGDGDGLSSFSEGIIGTNPYNSDSDGDSLPDWWEFLYGLNPLDSCDVSYDLDRDGLSSLEELNLGTSPNRFDSDNDLFSDGLEAFLGTDPLSSWDNPLSRYVLPLVFVVAFVLFVRRRLRGGRGFGRGESSQPTTAFTTSLKPKNTKIWEFKRREAAMNRHLSRI